MTIAGYQMRGLIKQNWAHGLASASCSRLCDYLGKDNWNKNKLNHYTCGTTSSHFSTLFKKNFSFLWWCLSTRRGGLVWLGELFQWGTKCPHVCGPHLNEI